LNRYSHFTLVKNVGLLFYTQKMKRSIIYFSLLCVQWLGLFCVCPCATAQIRVIDNKGTVNTVPVRVSIVSNNAAAYSPEVTIIDEYMGVYVTTTTACTVTLPDPTNTTKGKLFIVCNSENSTYPVTVGTYSVLVGTSLTCVWNGSAWETLASSGSNNISIQSGSYTVTLSDYTVVLGESAASDATFTLPGNPTKGQTLRFVNLSPSGNILFSTAITTASGTTISTLGNGIFNMDGHVLGNKMTIQYDGARWIEVVY
jgi:hypothetical protein